MKKLSIIIGGQEFDEPSYSRYLESFTETVLNNLNGHLLEIKGFEDVSRMRNFEKELVNQISAIECYSRAADEKYLTYTIKKQR